MRKSIIISIIIIFILIGIFVALYFFYEKPKTEEIINEYVNLNIITQFKDKPISTGYKIEGCGINKNSETQEFGAIQERVLINCSVKISNYNLINQKFYTSSKELFTKEKDNRILLNLDEAGKISIKQDKKLGEGIIHLTIFSYGLYKNLGMCAKWSSHIITIRPGLTERSKVLEYNNYDRCYNFNLDLKDNSTVLPLDYKYFSSLDGRDFIKLIFFDQDCNGDCVIFKNNTDIGGTNIEYDIQY